MIIQSSQNNLGVGVLSPVAMLAGILSCQSCLCSSQQWLFCFVDLGCVCIIYIQHVACRIYSQRKPIPFDRRKTQIQNSRNSTWRVLFSELVPCAYSNRRLSAAPVFPRITGMHPWWQCVVASKAWALRRSELCPKKSCRCLWLWKTSPSRSRRSPSPSLLPTWKNMMPGWLSLGQWRQRYQWDPEGPAP